MCASVSLENGYCERHQHLYIPKKPFQGYKYENPAHPHYLTKGWRRFTKSFLEDNPTCSICGEPSTVTDHFKFTALEMLQEFGEFIYEPSYYRPLCGSCNLATRNKRYKKPKKDI